MLIATLTFTLSDSLIYQLNGLIVVLAVLSSIWAVVSTIGLFFQRRAQAASPEKAGPTTVSAPIASPEPAVLVAIAAAVHAVGGARTRVISVTAAETGDWAREGRRQIFSSHKIR
jgi:Na+-transporting methylmalonyl-CoA/oxaloacetate decarboxylase gamma subunit